MVGLHNPDPVVQLEAGAAELDSRIPKENVRSADAAGPFRFGGSCIRSLSPMSSRIPQSAPWGTPHDGCSRAASSAKSSLQERQAAQVEPRGAFG